MYSPFTQSCSSYLDQRGYIATVANATDMAAIESHLQSPSSPATTTFPLSLIISTPTRFLPIIPKLLSLYAPLPTPSPPILVLFTQLDELINKGFQESMLSVLDTLGDQQLDIIAGFTSTKIEKSTFSAIHQIHDTFWKNQKSYSNSNSNSNSNINSNINNAVLPTKHLLSIRNKHSALTLDGIKSYYLNVEREDWKLDTLQDLWDTLNITQCVVFCNTIRKCEWLCSKLLEREFSAAYLVQY